MKLIKVPFCRNSGDNAGCEDAPAAILEQLELVYSSEDNHLVHPKLFRVEQAAVTDDWKSSKEQISRHIAQLDEFPIALGGDHSITYALFRGFCQRYRNAGLVIFDTHPDTYSGDDYLYEHGRYLRTLIEEGMVDPARVIIIGIRNADPDEIAYLKEKRVSFFTMRQLFMNIENVCDTVMEKARGWESLYISVDIDVLDPAFAPGTGCIEPGGMSTRELLYFIQRLKLLKNLRMLDIVEVNPHKDVNNLTAKAAAKIIGEFF
ncbi:arginase family protein [Candidatus Woesearchaeota archaeon]|nr:arginase family protein [Candidatus Woesearchaeota archaeon]